MPERYPPVIARLPHMIHGGDYNPEQWAATPEIWDEDIRLMKLAGMNSATVGVFSWSALEPEEGKFSFGWLDALMDKFAGNGIFAILSTPSGSRPAWLSAKHPDVARVRPDRVRHLHGGREKHCFTSHVYREYCRIINTKLAERYKNHPALAMWHISNEYYGDCHCDLCQEAFRNWLRKKYNNDIGMLNHEWWTAFWSHIFTDWSQIESPSPIGEQSIHGLNLDWKRFTTDQTVDFMLAEISAVRAVTPDVPVTTNMFGTLMHINYRKFVPHLDVLSWDVYPLWHGPEGEMGEACDAAFRHDTMRSMKGRPFLLMESVPSVLMSRPVNKPKRPGMHKLSSLQAVAHGSDSVQYFQWRMGRGGFEKFHGAVVDHSGSSETRVFRDVVEVGGSLSRLDAIVGTTTRAEVAIVFDVENAWAIENMTALGKDNRKYRETVIEHYRWFREAGIACDVIDQTCDISKYKLVVAPMLYMLRPGMAEKLEKYVAAGGTLVCTYWTGLVNENDLTYLGGFPGGGLRRVFGIWNEETDATWPGESNSVTSNGVSGLKGPYKTTELFAIIHAETAQVVATYGGDFYAGMPALTVNSYGKGKAWYIASRNERVFHDDFYRQIAGELKLSPAIAVELPAGVVATSRSDGKTRYIFLQNYNAESKEVDLGGGQYDELLSGRKVGGVITLEPYGVKVLAIGD